ncbi:MAG: Uncharacterized protein G01um101413_182 [Parcubacteria group bacterium Gr01-1014_13]|nr:MAG: Uncharacterized protein G01um101413_182 [Parcubacteria group bacterium Gr01-1014_13]
MEVELQKLAEIRVRTEEEYKKIGSVFCPYLKKQIAFNAKGLEHIKFKGRNKARSNVDQYIRLRSLPIAKIIIESSHTLQGYQERNEMVMIKKKKWGTIMKPVKYYEFVAVLKNVRLRVIVKQVEGGELHFWSIIPFWRMSMLGTRLLHNGNPAED